VLLSSSHYAINKNLSKYLKPALGGSKVHKPSPFENA
jgi:hypothetical protein